MILYSSDGVAINSTLFLLITIVLFTSSDFICFELTLIALVTVGSGALLLTGIWAICAVSGGSPSGGIPTGFESFTFIVGFESTEIFFVIFNITAAVVLL